MAGAVRRSPLDPILEGIKTVEGHIVTVNHDILGADPPDLNRQGVTFLRERVGYTTPFATINSDDLSLACGFALSRRYVS